jgi:hypothetical protein
MTLVHRLSPVLALTCSFGMVHADTTTLATSPGGRAIELITIADDASPGPGILIVAGVDPHAPASTRVARQLADILAQRGTAAPVYIVPLLNPDGMAHISGDQPVGPFHTDLSPVDDDRDRRTDEDGPIDINGDGVITMMRYQPRSGDRHEATHVVDDEDPRLMRTPEDGEQPTHALLTEGRDQDGDGHIAEDGPGGINHNRHFPALWDEFDQRAGRYPLDAPGPRALAEWMLAQHDIAVVIVLGAGDSIIKTPPVGKFDVTGQVPLGILKEDKATHDLLAEHFKELTSFKHTAATTTDGALHTWAYSHLGITSFAAPVWSRPDRAEDEPAEDAAADEAPEPEAPAEPQGLSTDEITAMVEEFQTADEGRQAEMMSAYRELSPADQARVMAIAQGQDDPGAPAAEQAASAPRRRAAGNSEDARWLAYTEEVGGGFVNWQAFDHPDLGSVEIGGFVPRFRTTPPDDAIPDIVENYAAFIDGIIEKLPKLEVDEPRVERLGERTFRISARVRNSGDMPTRSAMGVKARRLHPMLLSLDVDREQVISGDHVTRCDAIAPGAVFETSWIIHASPDRRLTLTVDAPELGTTTVEFDLTGEDN